MLTLVGVGKEGREWFGVLDDISTVLDWRRLFQREIVGWIFLDGGRSRVDPSSSCNSYHCRFATIDRGATPSSSERGHDVLEEEESSERS